MVAAGCWAQSRRRQRRMTTARTRRAAARGRKNSHQPLDRQLLARRMLLLPPPRGLLRCVRLPLHRPQPPQRQLLSHPSHGKGSCWRRSPLRRGHSSTKEAYRRTSGAGVLPTLNGCRLSANKPVATLPASSEQITTSEEESQSRHISSTLSSPTTSVVVSQVFFSAREVLTGACVKYIAF